MKKILIALLAIATLTACSKKDDDSGTTVAEGTFPVKITDKDSDGKVISVTEFHLQGGKILSHTHRSYENGTPTGKIRITLFSYNGNYITEEKVSDGEDSYTCQYTYNANKQLEKATYVYPKANSENRVEQYEYNGDNLSKKITSKIIHYGTTTATEYTQEDFIRNGDKVTVNKSKYALDADGKKVNETEYVDSNATTIYTLSNGNVIKEEEAERYKTTVTEYKYDDKKNPSLNNITTIIKPDYFVIAELSKNNISQKVETSTSSGSKSESNKIYEYTYSDKNYPLTLKVYKVKEEKKTLDFQSEYTY